jgi:hypothetical protein
MRKSQSRLQLERDFPDVQAIPPRVGREGLCQQARQDQIGTVADTLEIRAFPTVKTDEAPGMD